MGELTAQTVVVPTGMVASADHLASSAGVATLRAGGSAADAAIAAGAVLAVTSPHMSDLGGDLFAMVHRPGHAPAALCAAGRSGSGANAEQMRSELRTEGLDHLPPQGDIRAVTVPGCVDGWLALHRRFGALPIDEVLAPAIGYARAGFPASPLLAAIAGSIADLPGAEDFRDPVVADGGRLRTGTIVRRPKLAGTLASLAASGRSAFYEGQFGEGLIALGRGLFQPDDLARAQAEWVEPLRIGAWGHDLWAPPPPSQAYLTLAGAAVAESLVHPDELEDAVRVHLLAESARQVAWDRPRMLFDGADGAALLAPERLAARLAAVDRDRRGRVAVTAMPGDTTALTVVDAGRMVVSLVQSLASAFGARIIEPTTSVFLHNRGIGFSLEPGHPAEYRPGVRPPHTLSPALVTRPDGTARAVLGTMGGDSQPQILLQLLERLLTGNTTPGRAVAAPRWILGDGRFGTWVGPGPEHISLEADAPAAWEAGLVERGHRVVRSPTTPDPRFGHAQVITLDGERLNGAADPRSLAGGTIGY